MTISALDWNSLRPLDGSQENAFEELCVQLAFGERLPGATFVRKGVPDAGVECYWQLPNRGIRAWQAKFFREIPGPTQWRQIDESIETALRKHADLEQYTVCLPIDRPDPRVQARKSFMDKWESHKKKWRAWAEQRGMAVDFNFWGQSEILERLSRDEHRGRYLFWFQKDLFSQDWFSLQLEVAIKNAGQRYRPQLNVPLSLGDCFRGLGWTPDFFLELNRFKGEIRRKLSRVFDSRVESACHTEARQLQKAGKELVKKLRLTDPMRPSEIQLTQLRDSAQIATGIARDISAHLYEAERERANGGLGFAGTATQERDFGGERNSLDELTDILRNFVQFTESPEALLSDTPALLLTGNAGVGKTHLLCDVAKCREAFGQPTLILLGEQFSTEKPWSQILESLGLCSTPEEFLGALNVAGESARSRVLIFIDALNEGEGVHIWPKHLAGMLVQIRRYPWIGIALSVRDTYEDTIIPKGISRDDLITIKHRGFIGLESLAVTSFFAHYGIASPGVPLLQPEFSNPLFLTLFCEGISNRGLTSIPDGLEGLTAVFDYFLDSVNEKLSASGRLNFDPISRLVHRAIATISREMANADEHWLPREQIVALLDTLYTPAGFEKSLLRQLISEGVLSQDLFRTLGDSVNGIRFSYERFTDHQIAKIQIAEYVDREDPAASLLKGTPLGEKLKDQSACWGNVGLISALAIQLPEQFGKELPELAPHCARFRPVLDAMRESLMWRKHSSYSAATLAYLNSHLLLFPHTFNDTLRTLLSVSTQPGHPYNANFLHRSLIRRPLPERDAWWSCFIHYEYWEDQSPVKRLIEWAELEDARCKISDETLLLMGTTLAWFLTSSNRFLRDRATKVLVALFTDRIPSLCNLLAAFRTVDDMYVLERLMATAYGCAMRASNVDHLNSLATWCYESIFQDSPPSHILVRDYGRGVVERAVRMGAKLNIDLHKIRPPYGSTWPSKIPTKAILEPLGDWKAKTPTIDRSQLSIYSSVMNGDFASYVIGTNSGSCDWRPFRLGKPRPLTRGEVLEKFLDSLSSEQRTLWSKLEEARREVLPFGFRLVADGTIKGESDRELKLAKQREDRARALFVSSLDSEKTRVYRRKVLAKKSERDFDLSLIQRFVLKRVFDLGWTAERFGEFDRDVELHSNRGRDAHKAERLGKKYQWLAYHEALARIADNFQFDGRWSDTEELYDGPWQISRRDIDPSITIKTTHRPEPHGSPPSWWAPLEYHTWRQIADDRKWLRASDIPRIQKVLRVVDPEDGSRWRTLQGSYRWDEPTPVDKDWSEIPHRMIWYQVRSYVVRKKDFEEAFDWAKQQNFMGRWMPESGEIYDLFFGELFWSPAFRHRFSSIRGEQAWTQGGKGEGHRVIKPVIVTAAEVSCEGGGYDCSTDDGIRSLTPCPWLAESLDLHWSGVEGEFTNATGRVVARDPSVSTPGPSALLMRAHTLRKFLDSVDCDIFWTVLGEKQVIPAHSAPYPARTEMSGAMAIKGRKLWGRISKPFRDFDRERASLHREGS